MNLAAEAAAFLARRRGGAVSRVGAVIVERRALPARAEAPPAIVLAPPRRQTARPASIADDLARILRGRTDFPREFYDAPAR